MKKRAILLTALLVTAASAQTTRQLQSLEEQLKQARIVREQQQKRLDDLRINLQALSIQEQAALGTLGEVNSRLQQLEKERLAVERDIDFKKAQIANLDSQIDITDARNNRLTTQVQNLMRTLYREKSNLYIELLGREKNFYDVLIRRHYLDILSKQDLTVIEELRNTKKQLATQKAELAKLTTDLNSLQRQLLDKLEAVKDEKSRQQQAINSLKKTKAGQQALVYQTSQAAVQTQQDIANIFNNILAERARIEAERKRREEEERKRREAEQRRLAEQKARLEQQRRLAEEKARLEQQKKLAEQKARLEQQKKLADFKAEQERIKKEQAAIKAREDQLKQQAAVSARNNAPLPSSVGTLSFPIKGGRVVVPYGNGQLSTSIAGNQANAPVTAAAEGRVISITVNPNLGTMIMLAHNDANTMYTIYTGLQSPTVGLDQRVSRGQVIGYTGGSPVLDPNTFDFWVAVRSGGQTSYISPGF
ncbi:M23 family metallopeptidase [Deinococcus cellulosilyticus]|uniref:Peptidase M23 n=1 Tax=Deinococcus cellulosilyticus (strain DSM 18568 / NBRC 106333 / KACC 11606 / 5516J-15) TaxID=1223518 RepID=A0A511N5S0_DEIC1|nr:M23 family metallopeptidase [Deinococcus cellulosilyticus]GEM48184.1 peptidase M23 [Deinococcus cellulosilyticus NBRC 106333 = KACC 11606]